MELNMNTFVKGSKDFIDTSDSTAVIPAEPTTKRRASRKKNNEMVATADKGYIGVGYEKFKIVGNTKTKIYEDK